MTKLISRQQKPPQVRYADGGAKMHVVHDGETLQDIADWYGTQHIFDLWMTCSQDSGCGFKKTRSSPTSLMGSILSSKTTPSCQLSQW